MKEANMIDMNNLSNIKYYCNTYHTIEKCTELFTFLQKNWINVVELTSIIQLFIEKMESVRS